MNAPYKPRGDSVAARVVQFFKDNPDEELTIADIADKYLCAQAIVHALLARAVEAGILARSDSSGEWIYRSGAAPKSEPADHPVVGSTALERAWKPRRVRAAQTFVSVDPAAVPLDDGVPIPVTRGTAGADWSALLRRMKVGQSAVLPSPKRAVVSRACVEAKRAGRGHYVMHTDPKDKGTFRIWRTK